MKSYKIIILNSFTWEELLSLNSGYCPECGRQSLVESWYYRTRFNKTGILQKHCYNCNLTYKLYYKKEWSKINKFFVCRIYDAEIV